MLIDDFSRDAPISALGTQWRAVSDRVMGGVSEASLVADTVADTPCLRMTGQVSLDNNGGFIQMALDLADDGATIDLSEYRGLRLRVFGNDESYSVHLRTADNRRSWESYRAHFRAPPHWHDVRLPFADFTPHRLDTPLNLRHVRRIGLVAIGREFFADLCVSHVSVW